MGRWVWHPLCFGCFVWQCCLKVPKMFCWIYSVYLRWWKRISFHRRFIYRIGRKQLCFQ
jgi:hypothetical protein